MRLISEDGQVYLDDRGRDRVLQRMSDETLLQAVTYRGQQLKVVSNAQQMANLAFAPPHTMHEWEKELRRALQALVGELGIRSPGGDPRRPRPIDVPGGLGEQIGQLEEDVKTARSKIQRLQDALRKVRATGGTSATARRLIDAALTDRRCPHGTYRWTGQVCRECEAREDAERGE